MKHNLMQRDSLSHSFKMHLLLQMKQSYNQEGKEEDFRDLRVEINRIIIYCFKIISRKYITQCV